MTPKLPYKLGQVLAHVQDGVDQVVAFGFKSLKASGSQKPKKNDSSLKKTWLKAAGFLGETGSAFYDTYDELKKRRKSP